MSEQKKLSELLIDIQGAYAVLTHIEVEYPHCLTNADWEDLNEAGARIRDLKENVEQRIQTLNNQNYDNK